MARILSMGPGDVIRVRNFNHIHPSGNVEASYSAGTLSGNKRTSKTPIKDRAVFVALLLRVEPEVVPEGTTPEAYTADLRAVMRDLGWVPAAKAEAQQDDAPAPPRPIRALIVEFQVVNPGSMDYSYRFEVTLRVGVDIEQADLDADEEAEEHEEYSCQTSRVAEIGRAKLIEQKGWQDVRQNNRPEHLLYCSTRYLR